MGRGKAEDLRVEGFEDFAGMDLTDGTGTEMGKKTRRNGRIHWKEIAKRAEARAAVWELKAIRWRVACVVGSWSCFLGGAAVGFYFF